MTSPFPGHDRASRTEPDAASAYTLHSIDSPLLDDRSLPTYGAVSTEANPATKSRFRIAKHKPLLYAAVKCAAIFVVSSVVLGTVLWLALPTVDEEDREKLHVPKSFAQLQDLNTLLKKYRDIYPYRIVVCFVVTYLFLQAFSLPGSMYLSILGGAVWGMPIALPLVCACVATGAMLCYLLSAAFGPALLTLPKWKARLDKWSDKVDAQRSNLISFLIVLRIAPLPPHWVVNVLCPHLRIGIVPFWISTFFGIMGVTIIHTAIGGGLDEMTSADDFHLISWRNLLLLGSIVFAVLIPVGLRHVLKVKTPIPVSPVLSATSLENDAISLASDEFAISPVVKYTDEDPDNASLKHGTPPNRTINLIEVEMDDPEDNTLIATGGPEQGK